MCGSAGALGRRACFTTARPAAPALRYCRILPCPPRSAPRPPGAALLTASRCCPAQAARASAPHRPAPTAPSVARRPAARRAQRACAARRRQAGTFLPCPPAGPPAAAGRRTPGRVRFRAAPGRPGRAPSGGWAAAASPPAAGGAGGTKRRGALGRPQRARPRPCPRTDRPLDGPQRAHLPRISASRSPRAPIVAAHKAHPAAPALRRRSHGTAQGIVHAQLVPFGVGGLRGRAITCGRSASLRSDPPPPPRWPALPSPWCRRRRPAHLVAPPPPAAALPAPVLCPRGGTLEATD